MESTQEIKNPGIAWTDQVEDLVDRGDVDAAVSLLESVVSNLETIYSSSPTSGDPRLAAALSDLADLRSSQGFSIMTDELRSRALVLRARQESRSSSSSSRGLEELEVEKAVAKEDEGVKASDASSSYQEEEDGEDDWEAIADCAVKGETLLPSKQDETTSTPSLVDSTSQGTTKRRGRGSFLYQKSYLYSDQPDVGWSTSGKNSRSEDEVGLQDHPLEDEKHQVQNLKFGTSHVLVIYGFPVSTRTIDLEKLFDNFRDHGFAIRWVDDTTALAVFRTPSIACEAQSIICVPYKVRKLDQGDALLTKISTSDLEPPLPRPKTSARTAQRLIAQGMGIKLSTDFGSSELRKQEEARRNRILARQTLRDDAWGSD